MNNNHKYFHFCHLNNLASFLSTGFIFSDSIGSHFMQYYKSPITCDNDKIKLFHQEYLPSIKDKQKIVAIEIGDLFEKKNVSLHKNYIFKLLKNGFTPIKRRPKLETPVYIQNFLPITVINNIYFFNEQAKEQFFQMEYKNQISLDKNLYRVDETFFVGKAIFPTPNQELSIKDSVDFYLLFSKQFAEHIILMNFVIHNNQYTKNIDGRIPNNFDFLMDLESNEQSDLRKLIEIIRKEKFDIKDMVSNSISTTKESEWIFALSVWDVVRNNSPKLKIEEERENYIDIKKQYSFTIEDVKAIGKTIKEFLPKSDPIIQTLALFVKTNLDIDSYKVIKQIDNLNSKVVRDIFKVIYNLLRYGKRIERVRDIFIDELKLNSTDDILTNIIYASFIGIEKLPKTIKQPLNWEFAFDSFTNANLPLTKSFPTKTKEKWERYKWDFRKLPPWVKIKSDKIVRYNNRPFKLLFNKRYFVENLDSTIGRFPLINKHGFIFEIKESQIVRKKNEFYQDIAKVLIYHFIKLLPEERLPELVYGLYKNLLTPQEKFLFEDFISKRQPTLSEPDVKNL